MNVFLFSKPGKGGVNKTTVSDHLELVLVETKGVFDYKTVITLANLASLSFLAAFSSVKQTQMVSKLSVQSLIELIQPEWFVHEYALDKCGVRLDVVKSIPLAALKKLISEWPQKSSIAIQELLNYIDSEGKNECACK